MLCDAGALREPVLYLSLYFKARRVDYIASTKRSVRTALGKPWMEIVRETTGKQRRHVFAYSKYLAVLNRGTEPLSP
jgi:hypothetical protein